MMPAKRLQTGQSLATAGFLVAACSLLPFFSTGPLPLPLIIGGLLYLVGGFMISLTPPGESRRAALGRLRLVRIGMAVMVIVLLVRMAPAG
ncbi:MAG TPA: hypothetical protein PLB31_06375 [Fimbriimonadaceae bacterium]|nr:hypothetical protein [Armatimonadota bacterium]HCM72589.1 hypothetical protein [Armatimonadota bacterium]HRD30132.1 hypothetical protein [Fimbriimonadaceae bacterium]HRE94419.1 hypothetical protein [Fimbriimonadaceae bacterium]HRI74082.1 hypothetical protein [Fimbriimonadaceae bacterium]